MPSALFKIRPAPQSPIHKLRSATKPQGFDQNGRTAIYCKIHGSTALSATVPWTPPWLYGHQHVLMIASHRKSPKFSPPFNRAVRVRVTWFFPLLALGGLADSQLGKSTSCHVSVPSQFFQWQNWCDFVRCQSPPAWGHRQAGLVHAHHFQGHHHRAVTAIEVMELPVYSPKPSSSVHPNIGGNGRVRNGTTALLHASHAAPLWYAERQVLPRFRSFQRTGIGCAPKCRV